jgi:hypothetical protein
MQAMSSTDAVLVWSIALGTIAGVLFGPTG